MFVSEIKDFSCDGKKQRPLKGAGILRSHSRYPWFYPKPTSTRECAAKIVRRRNLAIETRVTDICEVDGLTFSNATGAGDDVMYAVSENNQTVVEYGDGVNVTFNQRHENDVDAGCGGFLICYKGMSSGTYFVDHIEIIFWAVILLTLN